MRHTSTEASLFQGDPCPSQRATVLLYHSLTFLLLFAVGLLKLQLLSLALSLPSPQHALPETSPCAGHTQSVSMHTQITYEAAHSGGLKA